MFLVRTEPDLWEASEGGLSVRAHDEELAAVLLGRAPEEYHAAAPHWPDSVTSALQPWPLKGAGTILFDVDELGPTALQLIGGGEGPLLVPNGAARLGLPTSGVVDSMKSRLGTALRDAFLDQGLAPTSNLSYGDLLRATPEVATGGLDLSRVPGIKGERRKVCLASKPFAFEVVPRKWTKGAVIRAVGRGGSAAEAGCLAGDLVIAVNGEDALNAPWEKISTWISEAEPPLTLDLAQPVLADPLYLREASLNLLRSLAGFRSARAAKELFPRVREIFAGSMDLAEKEPLLFAGDGGSASHVHTDSDPQIQMCHVLHGTKLFGVAQGETAASVDWISRWGAGSQSEVALPVDRELPPAQADWLRGAGVSVAAASAGDLLLFWGGTPHFGANALERGPCVALFHACEEARS